MVAVFLISCVSRIPFWKMMDFFLFCIDLVCTSQDYLQFVQYVPWGRHSPLMPHSPLILGQSYKNDQMLVKYRNKSACNMLPQLKTFISPNFYMGVPKITFSKNISHTALQDNRGTVQDKQRKKHPTGKTR